MSYEVAIKFIADPAQYDCAPLASLRGATPGAGWVARIDRGILSVISAPAEYMPVRIRIDLVEPGEHLVEWRVIDDRHELWLDGNPINECMSGFFLGDADTLYLGEDPEMPGKTYRGVLEVTIG